MTAETDQINLTLKAAGVQPLDVTTAISAYVNLDSNATGAVIGVLGAIASGKGVSLDLVAPILGAGLAMTGGMGAPVVAAVAAALPIIQGIVSLLSPSAVECKGWYIGYHDEHFSMCSNRPRPFGPTDRPYNQGNNRFGWQSWDEFANGIDAPTRSLTGAWLPPASSQIETMFPGYAYWQTDSFWHGDTSPEAQFRRVFYEAWKANKEYDINGYKSAPDYALLTACANAWNRSREPGTVLQVTATGNSYVNRLLAGDVHDLSNPTGQHYQPFALYTGPVHPPRQIKLRNIHGALQKLKGPVAPSARIVSLKAVHALLTPAPNVASVLMATDAQKKREAEAKRLVKSGLWYGAALGAGAGAFFGPLGVGVGAAVGAIVGTFVKWTSTPSSAASARKK